MTYVYTNEQEEHDTDKRQKERIKNKGTTKPKYVNNCLRCKKDFFTEYKFRVACPVCMKALLHEGEGKEGSVVK